MALLLTAVLSLPQASAIDDGSLEFWHSDHHQVGRWFYVPSTAADSFIVGSTFKFYEAYDYARNQWDAAGKPTSSASSVDYADIPCYLGDRSDFLRELNVSIANTVAGTVVSNYSHFAFLNFNGATKEVVRMKSKNIVCIVFTGYALDYYKNNVMHEMGHALGWWGHSSVWSDVMSPYIYTNTTLTERDIAHINQIY